MMKKILLASAIVVGMAAPAFASSCPTLVHDIDEALKTATLNDADKAKVMELRNTGDEQHKAGQHAESVASLTEAKTLLGM